LLRQCVMHCHYSLYACSGLESTTKFCKTAKK
jgi:hypothetical protein